MEKARLPALDRDPMQWIVAIAARQDREAFAALFGHYAPRIKAVLMRTGATAEAAEEFAQEALLTVWRKAATFDPARASASAWIFTIARNLRIDRLRRERRVQTHGLYDWDEQDAPDQPDAILDMGEREARVRNALKILPPDQMRVVELAFFEGHAHGEVARRLDIPLGTVKSRLRLATGRLREFLGDLT